MPPSPSDEELAQAEGFSTNAPQMESLSGTRLIRVTDNTVTATGTVSADAYGIESYAGYVGTETVDLLVKGNTVSGWGKGVVASQCATGCTTSTFSSVYVTNHIIQGNTTGLEADTTVDATRNWWGSTAGPGAGGNNGVSSTTNFPGGSGGLCPQGSPCTWAQILSNWPNAGIMVNTGWLHLKAGGPANGFDGNADAFTIGINGTNTTYDFENGNTNLAFVPESAGVGVGNSTVIGININNATNLYGFQFQVAYDATKVNATGVWADNATPQFQFFRTNSPASIPGGWNATCSAGVCKFAATHLSSQPPLSGSGTLAQITFTGTNGGTVPLAFTADILADRDGNAIPHTSGTGTINVSGYATISGTVQLEGRATPITTGTVTLHDASNTFVDTVVTFSATTGAWTANVPVAAGGSSYNLTARHSLYLRNELNGVAVVIGGTYPQATTMLNAGDANNDELVDVLDLSCVGASYGSAPVTCGATGNSDLNADGSIDIFDLVLVGSNYGLTAPQPW